MAALESTNTMLQNSFVKVADGSYAQQISNAAPASGTVNASAGPNAESGFGIGAVVAPAAGATIATHQPPAGNAGKLHKITATVWFSETAPAGAENANMAFKFGGTTISAIPAVPGIHIPVTVEFYFNAASGTPFSIIAVGAGTAAVKYNAFIVATKVVS
jgi:hypothetical protein